MSLAKDFTMARFLLKQGQLIHKNGVVYSGLFEHGFKCGLGIEVNQEGEYCGNFDMDKRNGKGVLKKKDGTVVAGIWQDGEMVGLIQEPNI